MANRRSSAPASAAFAATVAGVALVAVLLAPAHGGDEVFVPTVSPLSPSPSGSLSPRTSANEPPVAADAVAEVQAGGPPLVVDLTTLASDAETETAKLRFRLVDPPPRLGTAELRGSVVTYAAREGVEGYDAFAYEVVDRGSPDECFQREPDCAPPLVARAVVTITIRAAGGTAGPTVVPRAAEAPEARSPLAVVLIALGALALAVAALLLFRKMLRRRPRPRVEVHERPEPPPAAGGGGLGRLMDDFLGDGVGPPLWAAGQAARKVLGELGEERASPFLATAFWRALRDTSAFFGALDYAGASPGAFDRSETLVVPHAGGTRYDLIVFDPATRSSEPSPAVVAPSHEELARAWERITDRHRPAGALRRLPPTLVVDALREVADVTEFGIVVVPEPEIVFTGCPSPAWAVGCAGEAPSSTAGVVARDSEGRMGVTVAAHAVGGCDQVVVDGRPGNVVSTQPVQDSCFVEVDLDPREVSERALAPLRGMSPRQNEYAEFDGLRSGRTAAHVSGWDPTILTVEPYVQNKITTDPVTLPGDSGAALVGSEGFVLGFSFYVTAMSYGWPFSCWIWADSVFRAHGLEPLKEG